MSAPSPKSVIAASTVQLTREVDPREIDNPILSFFLAYWHDKRAGDPLPDRNDIRPRDFPQYLPWVVLIDADDEAREFHFRVVGTKVARYFLEDAAGKSLTEAYGDETESREIARSIFHEACALRLPIRITGPSSSWQGQYFPDWDALYLPLGKNRQTATQLFIAFTYNYEEYKRTLSPTSYLSYA